MEQRKALDDPLTIDWATAVRQAAAVGSAYVAGAVDERLRDELLAVDVDWRELDEQLPSGVYQQYTFASVDPSGDPVVGNLSAQIAMGIRECGEAELELEGFAPNEASFHRYQPDDAGLGRHRDMAFYRLLVIGITLDGSGELHLFDDDGSLTDVWTTEPGDLYLFRAPGLAGSPDGRPLHATGPCTGRTSLTLRYNQHGFGGGWGEAP